MVLQYVIIDCWFYNAACVIPVSEIGVIAGNTVWSMPERLECEVLQKARYINTLTFTFMFTTIWLFCSVVIGAWTCLCRVNSEGCEVSRTVK